MSVNITFQCLIEAHIQSSFLVDNTVIISSIVGSHILVCLCLLAWPIYAEEVTLNISTHTKVHMLNLRIWIQWRNLFPLHHNDFTDNKRCSKV